MGGERRDGEREGGEREGGGSRYLILMSKFMDQLGGGREGERAVHTDFDLHMHTAKKPQDSPFPPTPTPPHTPHPSSATAHTRTRAHATLHYTPVTHPLHSFTTRAKDKQIGKR